MEARSTRTVKDRTSFAPFSDAYADGGELTQKRLDTLLALNAETTRQKALFASEQEKIEASLIKQPLTIEKTYAHLGLLLGTFTPAAFFLRFLIDAGTFRREDFWIFGVFAVINLVSAIVGYFSGSVIGKIVADLEKESWAKMLFTLPFVGVLWGIIAGGAGGIIVFFIGAFFGALLGSIVGSAALPAFTVFHRLLKKGDTMDARHFLPIGFGITFVICALILGL